MRWKAPNERTQMILLSPILVPIVVVGAAIILPTVAIVWPVTKLLHHFFPPPRKVWPEWEEWFAWRPVCAEVDGPGDSRWVWRETIKRAAFAGRTLYRLPPSPASTPTPESI